MRMIVTGREGQVVRSLLERSIEGPFEVVPLGRPELDLRGPPEVIAATLEAAQPDVVVSAAAYTQVDNAEREPEQAFSVNARAPGALAHAASNLNVPLIQLSTDYVFDGLKPNPYCESDPTGPQGVYGASKLDGEVAVMHGQSNCAVLRTAWVYSPFGSNFVKTMLRLAAERDEVAVVADQIGNPTSALDIADGIIAVADNLVRSSDIALRGIFHMTAVGDASWAEFAEAVFAVSSSLGGPSAGVKHISTAQYPTPAKRPANSRLDSSKLTRAHGVRLPDWRESLKQVVSRLLRNGG